ncbi:MAG: hypothetical protein WCT01_04135 [Candidatus Shapirobacteria bacterium]
MAIVELNTKHLGELRIGSLFVMVGTEPWEFMLVENGEGVKVYGRVGFSKKTGEYYGHEWGKAEVAEWSSVMVRQTDWLDPKSPEVRKVVGEWGNG